MMMIIGFFLLLLLVLPWNIISMNLKSTCEQLTLPRECQCQFNRPLTINETRLRCRQLTEIKSNYHWSTISYDRLIFETLNDNLTLHRFVFTDLIVRSLHFHISYLFLEDHAFAHAYIGQLSISNHDTYARIDFQSNSQIFYGTTITNFYLKAIDFQTQLSEWIFSNARIYIFLIESSKFYGFTNENQPIIAKPSTKLKFDDFLDYDFSLPSNRSKSYPIEPDQTVIMNITSTNYPIYITIYTIISSINTTHLTDYYFPNNLEYSQLEEIELSFNQIDVLDAHVFRHLKDFQGRLILHHNQIQTLDEQAFDHLVLVKNLSLAKNFLSHISARHFQDLEQLNELDLSFNQLKQLTNNSLQFLVNLERLYLNSNPIEFIHPEIFTNLIKLKEIHFHNVSLLHSIDQQDYQWLWNLASLHVTHLLKTDFDLSDVAFCILSHYNQTLFHLSRQYSCSCNIHYWNRNENISSSVFNYPTNYLRLTPICHENTTDDLILYDLENQCDYQLTFLDCDAMTTTTVHTITTSEIEQSDSSTHIKMSTRIPSTTTKLIIGTLTTTKSLNNIKKLFTVLGTLAATTISAIMLVFLWYRCKTIMKRRRKKQSFVEQQRHFNSPTFTNHPSIIVRYASSDMSESIYSARISTTKSQSEALIEPSLSNTYKNLETIDNDVDEGNLMDDIQTTVET